jgi:hypothetical protein
MKRVYDRLAREALMQALRGGSRTLVADRVVGADSFDLFCEPDPGRLEESLPFGLVRRFLVQGPCALEIFHYAPSIPELLGSLQKAFDLRQNACWPPRSDEPWLWIICGHRPGGAWSPFALEPLRGFPRGVYATPAAYRMRLVLPNELPRTRDTLLLRLLGSGKPLQGALTELAELGASHPVGALMMPLIMRLHRECRALAEPPDEVAEFLNDTRDFCEAWQEGL